MVQKAIIYYQMMVIKKIIYHQKIFLEQKENLEKLTIII